MAFGFAGIFLAGAFAVGIKVKPNVVLGVLVMEGLFGWFIFLLFVFVNPAMDAAAVTGIPSPWDSRQNYNTFVAMGILASAAYCATLLGGQFSFTAGLYALSKGTNSQDGKFYRSRGIVYSALVFFLGLWLLIGGRAILVFFVFLFDWSVCCRRRVVAAAPRPCQCRPARHVRHLARKFSQKFFSFVAYRY
jgi:hypothetical protein